VSDREEAIGRCADVAFHGTLIEIGGEDVTDELFDNFLDSLARVLDSAGGRAALLDALGLEEARGVFMSDGSPPPRFYIERAAEENQ